MGFGYSEEEIVDMWKTFSKGKKSYLSTLSELALKTEQELVQILGDHGIFIEGTKYIKPEERTEKRAYHRRTPEEIEAEKKAKEEKRLAKLAKAEERKAERAKRKKEVEISVEDKEVAEIVSKEEIEHIANGLPANKVIEAIKEKIRSLTEENKKLKATIETYEAELRDVYDFILEAKHE